jgi:DNA (cytosine-5)-methyltransferase 1
MNELALFAGAGGGILGGKLLGWRTVCAVEFDEHARNVLVARQNDGSLEPFPIWDDVRTFDGKPWRGIVDVVSGGFPCQDISCAGNGDGLEGERSRLWREMRRIIFEVRPSFAFVENSSMLLIRGVERVLGDLAEMGYYAKWGVLGADSVGACHERKRIWILAYNPYQVGFLSSQVQSLESIPASSFERELKRAIDATIPSLGDSDMLRNHDDVAGWMERFERIGNGQVPGVVQKAWHVLCQRAAANKRPAQFTTAAGTNGLK